MTCTVLRSAASLLNCSRLLSLFAAAVEVPGAYIELLVLCWVGGEPFCFALMLLVVMLLLLLLLARALLIVLLFNLVVINYSLTF